MLITETIKSATRPLWHRWISFRDRIRLTSEKIKRNAFLNSGGLYHEWYAQRMDRLVKQSTHQERDVDPTFAHYMATGEEDLVTLQSLGMRPNNSLLEFGAGWGRSAQHFAKYLEAGNLVGCDSSKARLDYAKHHFARIGINASQCELIINDNNTFEWLQGRCFDYVWARAVFNHLPEGDIEEIFINVRKAMKPDAVFIFTFKEQEKTYNHKFSAKNFYHTFEFFDAVSKRTGFKIDEVTDHMPEQPLNVEYVRLLRATPVGNVAP